MGKKLTDPILRKQRAELCDFLPEHYSKVLEIGCAEGHFLDNLLNGAELWGIEPDQEKANIATSKLNKIFIATYEAISAELPERYYDLVICNDVIEHMSDPDGFLYSIKKKMKSDAYLIGSIPNVRYYRNLYNLLFKKDWKYEEKGILDATHLKFFTEKSLKRLFYKHNFKIDRFCRINQSCMASWKMKFFFGLLQVLTRTSYQDVRYQQFGFRLTVEDRNNEHIRWPSGSH